MYNKVHKSTNIVLMVFGYFDPNILHSVPLRPFYLFCYYSVGNVQSYCFPLLPDIKLSILITVYHGKSTTLSMNLQ